MSDPGDDNKLMPFADGVLDAAERAEVEAELAVRPELGKQLAPFMATRHAVMSKPFDRIVAEPVPEHLIALVMGGAAAKPAEAVASGEPRRSAEVLPFRRPEKKRASGGTGTRVTTWAPAAVAAAMLGVVALGSWQLQSTTGGGGVTQSVAAVSIPGLDSGELAAPLDALASRKVAQLANGWSVQPINTFAVNDKRWCRELFADKADGPTYAGVACRSVTGQWSLEAAAETGKVRLDQDKVVLPSAGPPMAVDDALRRLGSRTPVLKDVEAQLIAKGWRD